MKKFVSIFSIALFAIGLHAQTWTPLSVGVATEVFDLSFPADDTGFASLGNGALKKTVDGGASWTNVTLPGTYGGAVEFLSGNVGMILTDSGIVRTTNGGASWNVVYASSGIFWSDVTFTNSTDGFAAAASMNFDTFFVYKTIDGGLTWSPCTPIHDWLAVTPYLHFRTSTEGYLFGSDSIFRTTDAGATWTSVYASNNGAQVTTVCAADASTSYACDLDNFGVSKSTTGGVTWNSTSQLMASITYRSHFINANFGFMCGGNGFNAGFISQTVNGGTSWTSPVISPTTFLSMDFPSNTTGYCGGTAGVVMKYSGPLSIQDNVPNAIEIYPNPVTDFIIIENAEVGATIMITNSLGQVVKTETVLDHNLRVDVADLAEGIYFCSVISGEFIYSDKLVVE